MKNIFKVGSYWYAIATLVGSTIGIGLYGIPFTFQKAGFGIGLLFLAGIVGLVLLRNLLYGEVILRTHQRHQFIGYTNKYLGGAARKIHLFTFWVAVYGGLIAIIIISGNFLANIFVGTSPVTLSTVFIIVASVLVAMGLRTVSRFDFVMMLVFVFIIFFIGTLGAKHIDTANYVFATSNLWFLPFGVILFAMDATPGIPLVREVLVGKENKFKKAIVFGTLIPASLYLIFTLAIVGVSGGLTSPDAISGLLGLMGHRVVIIGSLFGFLTASTIFMNLAVALKESFQEDFYFKKGPSWLWVMVPPYVLFMLGIRNFIDLIGLVGGVAISVESIILIFLHVKAKRSGDRVPEYSIILPNWLLYIMMAIFAAAAVYTLVIK